MKKLESILFLIMLLLTSMCLESITQERGAADIHARSVFVDFYQFSETDMDAQNWHGLYIASNNKAYIGLCTHGDAANLYEFDIATRTMRHLANLTILLDERGRGVWTNGKIHIQMGELDGYVYFGSLCEDNGPPALDANSFQGPFWFRVRMSDGHVEALSKINSFWGITGQELDRERRIIYGLAEDGRFYRYFIDENYTEELGRVDNWDVCRNIFMDDRGNVYGSYAGGNIWKFDVEKDRIFDFEYLKLPATLEPREMGNPMLDRRSQWRNILWDSVGKVAYGLIGGNNILFKFDPHKGVEGEITPLANMAAPMARNLNYFDIPHATLAYTLSQVERKIYYIPVTAGDFDYGLPVIGRTAPSSSYLVSYDLETGEVEDLGIIRGRDGRVSLGMGAADTDKDGRIWFVGAFHEHDDKYVAHHVRGLPYSLVLGVYDPFGK
jgi:hypothetical protein